MTNYIAASGAVRDKLSCRIGQACSVIHPPVDTEFYRPARVRREAFYLLVYAECSTEGIQVAVEACRQARQQLVVLGDMPPSIERFLRLQPHTRLVTVCDRETLRDYYQRCHACLIPAASDFSAHSIEAQACGAPVISYALGSALETIIDAEASGCGTGVLFHELTAASMVSAMLEFERRPHRCAPALAVGNAARFSRSRFVKEIAATLMVLSSSQLPDPKRIDFAGRVPSPHLKHWYKPAA